MLNKKYMIGTFKFPNKNRGIVLTHCDDDKNFNVIGSVEDGGPQLFRYWDENASHFCTPEEIEQIRDEVMSLT